MKSPRNALLLLAAVALSAAPALSAAGAAPTAPHRASYLLTLKSAKSGSGIADVKGRMLFEIVDACDGWTVNQKLELRMLSNEAPELVTETSYTSWESKDGLRFRFDTRTTRNGVLAEQYRGSAELVDLESGGEATYTVPEERKLKLPKGTLFPTAHTEAVIQRAAAGETFDYRTLFDGSSADSPFGVSAVMRAVDPQKAGADAGLAKLITPRAWRIKLAFFPQESKEAEPDYELSVLLYENGVVRDMVLDYSNFSLNAKLDKAEPLSKPKC
ncbi:MAG TPA: cell envelope integrity EipB family protein [Alphaproteobacteria bacterium]